MLIIKIPFSAGGLGKTIGTEKAPEAICSKLKNHCIDESSRICTFEFEDAKVNNQNIEETHKNIFEQIKDKDRFIAIGGDHSTTYSTFKAFASRFKNPGIVVFDAHPDLMQSFDVPTHENYLRMLIEENIVKSENVVLAGIRNADPEELNFSRNSKINAFSMHEISMEGKEQVCDAVMANAKDFDGLFISIDIDVLDPAFSPATGYPEPGGMSTRELLYFIHRLKMLKNIKAFDIVEINPDKDINDLTVNVAVKIAKELF